MLPRVLRNHFPSAARVRGSWDGLWGMFYPGQGVSLAHHFVRYSWLAETHLK